MHNDSEFTANEALHAMALERARFAAVLGARRTARRASVAPSWFARLFNF